MTITQRSNHVIVALVAASVMLLTVTLPAQNATPAKPQAPPPANNPVPVYAPMAAKPGGPIVPRPSGYKVDAIEMTLFPNQAVEYKYRLDKGAVMIYSWTADAPVKFDFHTVPDGKPVSASERFEAAEKNQAHGVYTAPYAGLHGWWWENSGKEEVTIKITTAGFYESATMFSDGEPTPFEVKDPPPPELP